MTTTSFCSDASIDVISSDEEGANPAARWPSKKAKPSAAPVKLEQPSHPVGCDPGKPCPPMPPKPSPIPKPTADLPPPSLAAVKTENAQLPVLARCPQQSLKQAMPVHGRPVNS